MFLLFLVLHLLGAVIWTGGHLTLALTALPAARAQSSTELLKSAWRRLDKLALPFLGLQVLSGLYLLHRLVPDPGQWFNMKSPVTHVFMTKLLLLVFTLAVVGWSHAKRKQAPADQPGALAAPLWTVTILGILLIVAGAAFRI